MWLEAVGSNDVRAAAFLWFASIATIAAHVPARRATSIDPLWRCNTNRQRRSGQAPRSNHVTIRRAQPCHSGRVTEPPAVTS